MICTTAASSRSLSACTGSRRISPARAGSRLDRERWEHAALSTRRNPSLSGVIDEECSFVALLPEEVSQRKHDLREVAVHFPVCLLLFCQDIWHNLSAYHNWDQQGCGRFPQFDKQHLPKLSRTVRRGYTE